MAVIEFVLAAFLLGCTGWSLWKRDWVGATVAACSAVVLLFLGLDLLYGWLGS